MNAPEVDRALVQPCCDELFRDIEAKFKLSNIPNDKWYLTTLSTITTTSEPHLADQLYLYLISQPDFSSSESHKMLIRRIRETLFKGIVLIGLPKPTEALIAISRVEAEDGVDHTFSREGWKCDEENYGRGMTWLKQLYQKNTTGLFDLFNKHRDCGFWVANIAYGSSSVRPTDSGRCRYGDGGTPGSHGPKSPTRDILAHQGSSAIGHLEEGCRECVHQVARFCGAELDRIPAVDTVDDEL
ncbi:hypothetical protein N7532_004073 [Penicillium argentinense]|uniref:Uncharacterized protein n=1 Tax=Penicillium argentinense TaxID=1131581 RepID=A0A9W9KEJ9_9EURO|nr:uncharacterized protein N7532_004073 [Penicillium argentinense]KAJ5103544.1 hypothetical protein N7532_004073 [Penicillium argentinense]